MLKNLKRCFSFSLLISVDRRIKTAERYRSFVRKIFIACVHVIQHIVVYKDRFYGAAFYEYGIVAKHCFIVKQAQVSRFIFGILSTYKLNALLLACKRRCSSASIMEL